MAKKAKSKTKKSKKKAKKAPAKKKKKRAVAKKGGAKKSAAKRKKKGAAKKNAAKKSAAEGQGCTAQEGRTKTGSGRRAEAGAHGGSEAGALRLSLRRNRRPWRHRDRLLRRRRDRLLRRGLLPQQHRRRPVRRLRRPAWGHRAVRARHLRRRWEVTPLARAVVTARVAVPSSRTEMQSRPARSSRACFCVAAAEPRIDRALRPPRLLHRTFDDARNQPPPQQPALQRCGWPNSIVDPGRTAGRNFQHLHSRRNRCAMRLTTS